MEESGWKMVAGDVFRSPKNATLLCVQLGSGVQIILSSFITLFFAALGKLSQIPLSRQLHYIHYHCTLSELSMSCASHQEKMLLSSGYFPKVPSDPSVTKKASHTGVFQAQSWRLEARSMRVSSQAAVSRLLQASCRRQAEARC